MNSFHMPLLKEENERLYLSYNRRVGLDVLIVRPVFFRFLLIINSLIELSLVWSSPLFYGMEFKCSRPMPTI